MVLKYLMECNSNIIKPLAASIKGRTIGDRVTIGDTNREIEIIESGFLHQFS
jgi:hypothetical protein